VHWSEVSASSFMTVGYDGALDRKEPDYLD
jgi:hypothetical protein